MAPILVLFQTTAGFEPLPVLRLLPDAAAVYDAQSSRAPAPYSTCVRISFAPGLHLFGGIVARVPYVDVLNTLLVAGKR